jgi:peptidoglycan/LPS O-acetylase OafA/YrhL
MIAKSPEPAEYRRALNGLRGFAATYVVLYHFRYYSEYDWFASLPFLQFGYIGVDFFFILSGLIISHVYLEKSRAAQPRFWLKFVWLRLSRLLPVHLLLMVALLSAAIIGPILRGDAPSLTQAQMTDWLSLTILVRQWFLPDGYAWNSPAWSVSAELFAYLFIFPLICRFGHIGSRKTAIALIFAGVFLWSVLMATNGTVNVIPTAGPLIRVTAGFLAGSGLYVLLRSKTTVGAASRDWNRILALTLFFAVPVWMLALTSNGMGYRPDMLLVAYVTVLICSAYQAEGWAADILGGRFLFWLGEISFALYLCHIPIMRLLSYVAHISGWERGVMFSVLCLVSSVAVAHLLFRSVELPSRNKLRILFEKSQRNKHDSGISEFR